MTQLAGVPKEAVAGVKPNTSHYHIYFTGGGALPPELRGLFVKKTEAEKAIQLWSLNKAKPTGNKEIRVK